MSLLATKWEHTEFQGIPEACCNGRTGRFCGRGAFVLGNTWECRVCGSLEKATESEIAYFELTGVELDQFDDCEVAA